MAEQSSETKIDDGGQAFPRTGFDGPDHHDPGKEGMSLRDYFAAKAMQGSLAGITARDNPTMKYADVAKLAYFQADAMIAARKGAHP